MKICICASMRHKEAIVKVAEKLDKLNISYILPRMELPKERETSEMVPGLVYEHLEKINNSDVILVVNPEGYFGNSVKVEIGYAKGQNKKIYFLEKTNEPELDCLADKIVPLDDLEKVRR